MAETAGLGAGVHECAICYKVLTGTLGSDTAMLAGYTETFTHWVIEAAKRYGSSARSHRLLWEQLDRKRDTNICKQYV